MVGLVRPEVAGIALMLIAALAVPWLAPSGNPAPNYPFETLGLGVFALAAAVALWGWMLYRRAVPARWSFWRRWLGAAALGAVALGPLSVYRAPWPPRGARPPP